MQPENDERRPGEERRSNVTSGDRVILRLSATVSVHLDHHGTETATDLDRADRHALYRLMGVPPGAHVRVIVGSRKLLTTSAVQLLHASAQRLDLELDATDGDVARRWYSAITAGSLS